MPKLSGPSTIRLQLMLMVFNLGYELEVQRDVCLQEGFYYRSKVLSSLSLYWFRKCLDSGNVFREFLYL